MSLAEGAIPAFLRAQRQQRINHIIIFLIIILIVIAIIAIIIYLSIYAKEKNINIDPSNNNI
jgi:ABC-type lipoprotein release transport system permease subunit